MTYTGRRIDGQRFSSAPVGAAMAAVRDGVDRNRYGRPIRHGWMDLARLFNGFCEAVACRPQGVTSRSLSGRKALDKREAGATGYLAHLEAVVEQQQQAEKEKAEDAESASTDGAAESSVDADEDVA